MKKIVTVVVAGLIFIAGAACGGGASWSDADKAQLEQGKTLAVTLGAFTQKQAECYGDWLQDNYDSMADATADENDPVAQKALWKACDIANNSSDEDEEVTTTTIDSAKAEKISLCSDSIDNIVDGLNIITDGVGNAVAVGGSTAREFVATAIEFVGTSITSVQLCADLAPVEAASTLDSLFEVWDSLGELEKML